MLKAGMYCARVNQGGLAQLLDASESLDVWMLYELKQKVVRNADKSMHRIIYYFPLAV